MSNHFDVLQVPLNANDALIKQAYHQAARQHHPDKNGTSRDFVRIQAAYECLRQSDLRDKHRLQLSVKAAAVNKARKLHASDCTVKEITENGGEVYHVYVYKCQCGCENEISDEDRMECAGCSIVYNVSGIETD
jgi:DnaJ-class molecular chaperone